MWILSKKLCMVLLKKQQQLRTLCIREKGFLMKCWILSGTCSNHCVRYRFLNFRLLLTYHWAEKEVKEECAFNYPRLSFNLIYYRTLRSLPSPVFLSFWEVFSRWISVWMLCHIVWKSLKMSHLNVFSFDFFRQFLSY